MIFKEKILILSDTANILFALSVSNPSTVCYIWYKKVGSVYVINSTTKNMYHGAFLTLDRTGIDTIIEYT
jgi:hypothetical protein